LDDDDILDGVGPQDEGDYKGDFGILFDREEKLMVVPRNIKFFNGVISKESSSFISSDVSSNLKEKNNFIQNYPFLCDSFSLPLSLV
jgi:hypothetical protein